MAQGVRVVVSEEFGAAPTCRLVRREKRRWIDLKPDFRLFGHVIGRLHGVDPPVPAKQQAAAFARRCSGGSGAQPRQCGACDFDAHSYINGVESGESIIEGVIAVGGQRLDKALAQASGLSRERIKALLGGGRIELAGAMPGAASSKPAEGIPFRIRVPEAESAPASAEAIPLAIVFEDEHLIVVDKPAGLVVHPAAGNRDGTLVNALLHHCAGRLSGIGGVARPGIVHRIDKNTSGLLVVAKTEVAHEGLARQFADHSIERAYRALVAGYPAPPAGTVRQAIARSATDRKKMAPVEQGRGKHAVTHFRTLDRLREASLVECRLETGRTHQVRVHMTSIGHPLIGDPVYGRIPMRLRPLLAKLDFRRQALHAAELGFVHPVTQSALRFCSAMPADMSRLMDELRY